MKIPGKPEPLSEEQALSFMGVSGRGFGSVTGNQSGWPPFLEAVDSTLGGEFTASSFGDALLLGRGGAEPLRPWTATRFRTRRDVAAEGTAGAFDLNMLQGRAFFKAPQLHGKTMFITGVKK